MRRSITKRWAKEILRLRGLEPRDDLYEAAIARYLEEVTPDEDYWRTLVAELTNDPRWLDESYTDHPKWNGTMLSLEADEHLSIKPSVISEGLFDVFYCKRSGDRCIGSAASFSDAKMLGNIWHRKINKLIGA